MEGAEKASSLVLPLQTGHWFGMHNPENEAPSYERRDSCGLQTFGWKHNLRRTDELVGGFKNTLSQSGTFRFWYKLKNKRSYWEIDRDQESNSLEDVDLFFAQTHGQDAPYPEYHSKPDQPEVCPWWNGNDTVDVTWSMWNWQTSARGSRMILGDEGRGLSIFATYCCRAGHVDENLEARWLTTIFSGGLRMALSFHGKISWCAVGKCPSQLQHGARFAQYLIDGLPIWQAWLEALHYADQKEFSPVALGSGDTVRQCLDRVDAMTWYNFKDFSRIKFPRRLCGYYYDAPEEP